LAGPLGIKLRCSSWQQLATIYRRDLSRGTMFLKASSQPPLGTAVRIDLELPSATVIELTGTIDQHVVDPQRGTGVELKLEPLPTKTIWLIESALSAEAAVRAGSPPDPSPAIEPATGEGLAEAEDELIIALEAEAESLKRLNPFLVLGVGYEANDADVRGAFGELTKRYHPDRFQRYQSTRLRQLAAEIFILIRDAYRKLSDDASRVQVRQQLGVKPARAKTPPPTPRMATGPVPVVRVPNAVIPRSDPPSPPPARDNANAIPEPPRPTQYDAPTNPSDKSAAIASTQLARPEDQPGGVPSAHVVDRKSGPVRRPQPATALIPSQQVPIASGEDGASYDALVDQGKLDEALAGYRAAAKRNANDRGARAGIELIEGLRALAARDRLEAAQRFEAALEIDPSNERAARELADMRRQATNERKGLLSRLMGKKEGPT
jgi:curved DNA-binding protein CbpA